MNRPIWQLQFSLPTVLISAIVAAVFFGWCAESRGQEYPREVEDAIKKVNSAGYFLSVSLRYRELFKIVGKDELSSLQRSPDDSIAIQSAWEKIKPTVPRTRPYRPVEEKLAEFLEFIEARSPSPVPKWWAEVIQDGQLRRGGTFHPGKPSKPPYHHSGIGNVNAPMGTTVTADDKRFFLKSGDDSSIIPNELLQLNTDTGLPLDHVSAAFTKDRCFFAIHGDAGHPPIVASVDRASGNLLWKMHACGCWWGNASGVHNSGWISVVAHDDRVVVFGKAHTGVYAHGFQQGDGKTLFRFSSSY